MPEKNNKWRDDKYKRFVNPYNFVPLEGKCKRKPWKISYKDGMTGYIECVLRLLTPLFIPNTSNEHALIDNLENKSYDFFSYEDLRNKITEDILENPANPVIPASEIRGVVRSIHETIFNSCMSSIDLKRQLERRCQIPKKPGLLTKENGKWKLITCTKYSIEKVNDIKGKGLTEGQEVCFGLNKKKKAYINKNPSAYKGYLKEGYLHIGEPRITQDGRGFFIFQMNENSKNYPIEIETEDTIKLFEKILEEYSDKKINKNLKDDSSIKLQYRKDIDNGVDNEHFGYTIYCEYFDKIKKGKKGYKYLPVYYDKLEGKIHLSPACIGREAYYNKLFHILKENGEYQPCEERKNICPSCALFGMVSKEKGQSIASRIRFEDAELIEKEKFNKNWFIQERMVLPDMGEPKSGAVEFYTIPPKEAINGKEYYNWTYDYINLKGKEKKVIDLNEGKLQIRGRKFYWHSQPKKFSIFKDGTNLDKMEQVIRPLNDKTPEGKNVEFKFRVYFENISSRELEELKLALNFDEDCAYKFGRAKPLGFGSAKIQIEKIIAREIELKTGEFLEKELDTKVKDEIKNQYLNKESLKTLKVILNWKELFKNNIVQYPLGEDETIKEETENKKASHLWFAGNRGDNPMQPIFSKILPKPEEEKKENEKQKKLYKLIKEK